MSLDRSELEALLSAFKADLLAEIRQYLHLQTEDARIYPYLAGDILNRTTYEGEVLPLHIATVRLANFCGNCTVRGFATAYMFQSVEELVCGQCGADRSVLVPNAYFKNQFGS